MQARAYSNCSLRWARALDRRQKLDEAAARIELLERRIQEARLSSERVAQVRLASDSRRPAQFSRLAHTRGQMLACLSLRTSLRARSPS